jgi:hypothetical protein
MGAARAIAGDLSVFSISTVEQKTTVRDASIAISANEIESSPVTTVYERADGGARNAVIKANLMSVVSGSIKVSHLDVSAFSIGGTAYIGDLESGSFGVEWQHDEGKGNADGWLYPVFAKKRFQGEGTLRVLAATGAALPVLMAGTLSSLNLDLTITINGVTVTVPCLFKMLTHTIPQAGVQKYAVQFSGQAPDADTGAAGSGQAITLPTGSTTLLEKAFNTKAVQAFQIDTKAAGGARYSGNMLLKSANYQWSEGQLVMAAYEWNSQGAITVAQIA